MKRRDRIKANERCSLIAVAFLTVAGCGTRRAPLLPSDDVVRACMTAVACGVASPAFQDCVSELTFGDPQALAASGLIAPSAIPCLAAAGTDCARAQACGNNGMPASTCDGTIPAMCDGDVVHKCAGESGHLHTAAFDCASVGLHCFAFSQVGGATCGYGSCPAPGETCEGTTALRCENGVLLEPIDCTQYSAVCGTTPSGNPGCVGTGATCTSTYQRCDGDTAVACGAGNPERRTNCAAQGLRCVTSEGSAYCDDDTQCQVDSAGQTCNGGRLTYCFAGMWLTADCIANGFSGCAQSGCTL